MRTKLRGCWRTPARALTGWVAGLASVLGTGLATPPAGAVILSTVTSTAPLKVAVSSNAVAPVTNAMTFTAASQIPAYVYKGAGCTGVQALPQYEAILGRKVDGVTDFLDDSSTWPNLVNETNWALGCWQGNVNNVDISLPMVVSQHDSNALSEVASGQFKAYFVQVAKSLMSHGFPNAYIRVGWEFNGGWYPWTATASPAAWQQGFREIVSAMRSVPGQHFHFVWNPALYEGQFWPDQAYPGDDVVDVIATDAYNQSWDAGYTSSANMWNSVDNDSWGVAQVISFAKQHNKPVAFPEWGTGIRPDGHGGGDDPLFIANMAKTMASANVAFQSYWDYPASDYNAQLSNGQYPAALAAFMAAFGSTSAGAGSSLAAVKQTGAIVTANAAPFTAPGRLVISATGCSEAVVQNSPKQYEVIVNNATATKSCKLSWTLSSTGKVYDPSVGSAPTRTFGASTTTTVALKANVPLIVVLVH
jgi:hypothetical protein